MWFVFIASNNFCLWLVDCFIIFIVSKLKCQTTTPSPTVLWSNSWFIKISIPPSRIKAMNWFQWFLWHILFLHCILISSWWVVVIIDDFRKDNLSANIISPSVILSYSLFYNRDYAYTKVEGIELISIDF